MPPARETRPPGDAELLGNRTGPARWQWSADTAFQLARVQRPSWTPRALRRAPGSSCSGAEEQGWLDTKDAESARISE